MPNTDTFRQALFTQKPECVIDLPHNLLSAEKIKKLRAIPGLAIVEIAGRDSVAAAAACINRGGITDILPIYVYTGTEHGSWQSVEDAVNHLSRLLPHTSLHDLIVMGSPGFWHALNGRYISELISQFGFYVPCIGCHLYLHSIRIPLAVTLRNVPIISGERELHDGRTKVNQIAEALNVYEKIAEEFGIKLLFPIRHIEKGYLIEEILKFEWKEGKGQLGCVLSGNYRKADNRIDIAREQVQNYFEFFAYPASKIIIQSYIKGIVPNHVKIAGELLGS